MDVKKLKQVWKKTWHFIWEEDSIASWVVNVILAFVIIKFLVFPGLGFLLHTTHPIVAVVSNSMEHNGDFDNWWNSAAQCESGQCTQGEFYAPFGVNKDEFLEYRFKNGFNKGDIMVLYGVKPKDLKKGDVLVFQSSRPDPIIHRIVDIRQDQNKFYYQTKGDHNPTSIKGGMMNGLDETNVPLEATIGYLKYERSSVAVFRIPFLGYIKIWFVAIVKGIAGLF